MEDQIVEIAKHLKSYSDKSDSDEAMGPLYALQELSKKIPRDVYLKGLKQGLIEDMAKGNNKVLDLIQEIEPSILEYAEVKEGLAKLKEDQKNKDWEI